MKTINKSKLSGDLLSAYDKIQKLKEKDSVKGLEMEQKFISILDKKNHESIVSKPIKKSTTKKATKNKTAKKTTGVAKRRTVMTVAKEIRKKDESWQDALKRAKLDMNKSTKKQVTAIDDELSKLKNLIKNDKNLKGFKGSDSDLIRDASRKALPKGKRISKKGGKNQHGTSKGGRVYYENRENRSDRYAPKYPKDKPYLKYGGDVMSLGIANADAVYSKGGVILEYSKIYEILKDKIDDSVEDIESTYDQATHSKGEEVESKSRDGFIPFTNGGYSSEWFEYSNMLEGSGMNLPTKSLDDKIEEFRERNIEYGFERFEEEYPEIVEELGGIDNVNYSELEDAGYSSEADDLDMFMQDDDDSILMKVEAFYYNPNNDRGENGKHTIQLSGVVNLEAPYHRSGNLEDFIEERFTFDSYKELEDKLDKGLAKVVSWFEGDMYDKNPRELKIRRMESGGKTKRSKHSIMQDRRRVSKQSWEVAYQKRKAKMEKGGEVDVRDEGNMAKTYDGRIGKITKVDGLYYTLKFKDGNLPYKLTLHQKDVIFSNSKFYAKGGEMSELKKGQRVRIFNTQYDGKQGLIVAGETDGKYSVQLEDGKVKGIERQNLMLLSRDIFSKGGKTQDETLAYNFNREDIVKNVLFWKNDVIVQDKNGKVARIDLDKGERIELNAKGGEINTSKKGVYLMELKDGTFRVSNNLGDRDFPYEFNNVFPTKERAMKFANRVAKNSKSKVVEIKYAKGGEIDLFEDYQSQPKELSEIVEKYEERYADGDMDYKDTEKFLKEVNAIGYTFDSGLDNEPYNLRPMMAKGGDVMSLGISNADAVFKKGGELYTPEEAMEFANRISKKLMAKGGRLSARTQFSDYDFDKLSYDFVVFNDRVETEDGKVVGTINSKGHLVAKGDKTLKNPLVKWLQQNSYVSNDEYYKLAKGGETEMPFDDEVIVRNSFDGDRKKYKKYQKEVERKRNEPLPFAKGGAISSIKKNNDLSIYDSYYAKGGLTDSKYIPTYEIYEVVTKDGKVYENDYSAMQFLSGAYVSDKVVTKPEEKDGSQMTLFDKGGKIPKGAIYIKRRDIDFITVGEDEDDKEKVSGKNLFNGFWIDPKKQKTLISEAIKDGRLGKSKAKKTTKGGEVLFRYKVSGFTKGGNELDNRVAKTLKDAQKIKKELLQKEGVKKVEITKNTLKKPTYAKGGNVPVGFHKMPNGEIMADSEHLAKGGRTISIVNDGVNFDKSKYKAVYGDFDKDGTVNIDDANPLDSTKKNKVEQVELKDTFDKLLGVKAELDNIMYDAVDTLDKKAPKDADIYARTKTPYSILKKLVEKRMLDPEKGLTDMIGTTIAVDSQKELENVRDDIDGGLLGKVLDKDDYYKSPKAGYRAYHYIVEYKGVPVEVQLKTKNMKKLHEVSHEAYKNGTLNAKSLDSLSKTFMRADKGDAKAKAEISKLLSDKKLLASKVSKSTMAKGGKTKTKKPNSFFAVVKREQKEGESWKDAIQRVKKQK